MKRAFVVVLAQITIGGASILGAGSASAEPSSSPQAFGDVSAVLGSGAVSAVPVSSATSSVVTCKSSSGQAIANRLCVQKQFHIGAVPLVSATQTPLPSTGIASPAVTGQSCEDITDVFYQEVTEDGVPTGLIVNLTLESLIICDTGDDGLTCADGMQALPGSVLVPTQVYGENTGNDTCSASTTPPAESFVGDEMEGVAAVEDHVTGATALFGPYTFVLTGY